MAESQAGWSKYQEEVSRYLDSLGFETKINERLVGQLTSHDIDVAARYCKAGLSVLWVVECKFWNRRVPKEKVGTLKAIVADVGADRGLLVSQLGFQSGANAFAKNTNITLMTLEQLRTSSVDELREIRTRAIADSTWDLIDRLDTLKILTPIGARPPIHVVDYPEGVDSRLVQGGLFSRLRRSVGRLRLRWLSRMLQRGDDSRCA